MPKALASLPSARVRRLSLATPIMESSMESRSWSRRSFCFCRKGVIVTFFAGFPFGLPASCWTGAGLAAVGLTAAAGLAVAPLAPFPFAGALAAGFATGLGAGLVLVFATLAAGFFALFTGLVGAVFFDFAADLAGLDLAIKIAGRDRSVAFSGKMR